jgi:hypothetical protein
MEDNDTLLSTENVRGRIREIDSRAKDLANEIAERHLAQKRLSDERRVLVDLLSARGDLDGLAREPVKNMTIFPIDEAQNRPTIQEAILRVLQRESPNPIHSDDILREIRGLGAGSEKTNRKNVEWHIWKIKESYVADEVRGNPVILGHGPHLYSVTERAMLEGV